LTWKELIFITKKYDSAFRGHYIESSLLVLADFLPDSQLYQLNFGYMITKIDIIIAKAIARKYSEQSGTYPDSKELYPGNVRAYRTDNIKIQEGFQLFL
jgi:hypothetical protein